jgi:hypothetical protein
MNIISLGAGVQSTTMSLMAAEGLLTPMPDCAIFADTQWEPAEVYRHLDRLEKALPFPIHRVTRGDLREAALHPTHNFAFIPWHLVDENGKTSIGQRECTNQYKLKPIRRKIVELHHGRRKRGETVMWLGISLDEAHRMKPSRVQYIENRWPLIEARISRIDCRAWLAKRGWTAPKSSCIGCPYRSQEHWRALTADERENAIEVDNKIRWQRSGGAQFMHSSKRPLALVDLRSDNEIGQGDLFGNDCEGMCGV